MWYELDRDGVFYIYKASKVCYIKINTILVSHVAVVYEPVCFLIILLSVFVSMRPTFVL